MTEAKFLASTDPAAMLRHLTRESGRNGGSSYNVPRAPALVSARKLRLLACACCRLYAPSRVWLAGQGWADELLEACELAEDVADGRAQLPSWNDPGSWVVHYQDAGQAAALAVHAGSQEDVAGMAALLRCIVGNPFRPVRRKGTEVYYGDGTHGQAYWLTPTVVNLARACYDSRFTDPPAGILADALEEAGCTDADILNHLRGPGPHARGCWAVDLILGLS